MAEVEKTTAIHTKMKILQKINTFRILLALLIINSFLYCLFSIKNSYALSRSITLTLKAAAI